MNRFNVAINRHEQVKKEQYSAEPQLTEGVQKYRNRVDDNPVEPVFKHVVDHQPGSYETENGSKCIDERRMSIGESLQRSTGDASKQESCKEVWNMQRK